MSYAAIQETNYHLPGQTSFYRGKVRDVYHIGDRLVIVASDRLSAFDHVLPRPIPFKGQVLNQTALHFLEATRDIVPNWLEQSPDPNVAIGKACAPFQVEMVIRGYLAGHAWRTYQSGARQLCGVDLPEGLRQNDQLPTPIITPATKAEQGHDEDISREQIIRQGLVSKEDYEKLEAYTQALFARGSEMARERGLILVDTKYEFGKFGDDIYLIDEIHTPDSSRYFHQLGYEERQQRQEPQRQLSKEFVREWLMDHGFQGKEGQLMPELPDAFLQRTSQRYIELFETITGKPFQPRDTENMERQIYTNIMSALDSHSD